LKRTKNIDFAVIDYIGLINGQQKSNETTVDYYTRMSKDLKALALQLQIPIIVLVQLNRECVKNNRKPVLSDIKDSGSFEQDADMVIMLHRLQTENTDAIGIYKWDTEMLILKTRVGSVSGGGVYIFNGRTQQFLNKPNVVSLSCYRDTSRGY
jgi:replicative DNA helicase